MAISVYTIPTAPKNTHTGKHNKDKIKNQKQRQRTPAQMKATTTKTQQRLKLPPKKFTKINQNS